MDYKFKPYCKDFKVYDYDYDDNPCNCEKNEDLEMVLLLLLFGSLIYFVQLN